MKLYELLTEEERRAVKALNVRNVHLKDITIEELSDMSDVIAPHGNGSGALCALEEIIHRQPSTIKVMNNLKLKDYKYEIKGKETDRFYREIAGPFVACMIPFLALIFISGVLYFADWIDAIDPLYQMLGTVLLCSVVFVICILKTMPK